jgi:hypothetical protein
MNGGFWYDKANQANFETSAAYSPRMNTDEPYSWDTTDALDCQIEMTWVKLGRVLLINDRLKFLPAQSMPGLYRFRLQAAAGEASYIGETENMARRFGFYSNPGPSQQTNIRLNARFREALSNRAEIAVAIVTTDAWLAFGGIRMSADFSSKAVRRLFENAVIAQRLGDEVESLNR